MWKYYALLSAFFAALTAVFAKIGVKNINSDLATAIRTTVILLLTWGIVAAGRHLGELRDIGRHTWLFLKEHVSPRVILGAVLITAGSIVMIVK